MIGKILYHRIIYVYVFVFILQMNKGKEIVTERENGEEIYAKDSMKLEGVQVKSNSVL